MWPSAAPTNTRPGGFKMATLTAPAPVQTVSAEDSFTAAAWGFTDWQWAALTQAERVELRSSVAYAPNLCTEGK